MSHRDRDDFVILFQIKHFVTFSSIVDTIVHIYGELVIIKIVFKFIFKELIVISDQNFVVW